MDSILEVPGLQSGGAGGPGDLGNKQELVKFLSRVMAKRKEMKWD